MASCSASGWIDGGELDASRCPLARPVADVTEIAILTAHQHNTICVSKQRRSSSLQHCGVGIITMSAIRRATAGTESLIGFDSNDGVTEVLEPAGVRPVIPFRSRRSARKSPLAL